MQEIEAISGVFIRGEEVLLTKRSAGRSINQGKIDLVGGDIQAGKSPEEVLRDDAKGKLNISDITVLATMELVSQENDALIHRRVSICRGNYNDIQINSRSYSEATWFRRDKIPIDNLTPHAKNVLKVLGYME